MTHPPTTWHHGLVADWWALFNTTGDEIEYYRRFVVAGQPALDAGCGTGRLLVPWLRDGLDVDGCDASADMIRRCRARARVEGLEPMLFVQALHQLDPPRRYRTIVACGVFGLGTTRAEDEEALRRLRAALEPGGTLALDIEVPWANAPLWRRWTREERNALPMPPRDWGDRRSAPDGSVRALRTRTLSVDPLDQSAVLEIEAGKWEDGRQVAHERHELTMRLYFPAELELLLERAGFTDIQVRGGYDDAPQTPDHDFLVFVAVSR
jgi:SAM-dependent methyltransferase